MCCVYVSIRISTKRTKCFNNTRTTWCINDAARKDGSFNPDKSGVRVLHFKDEDFCGGKTTTNTRRGNKILKRDATPLRLTPIYM